MLAMYSHPVYDFELPCLRLLVHVQHSVSDRIYALSTFSHYYQYVAGADAGGGLGGTCPP